MCLKQKKAMISISSLSFNLSLNTKVISSQAVAGVDLFFFESLPSLAEVDLLFSAPLPSLSSLAPILSSDLAESCEYPRSQKPSACQVNEIWFFPRPGSELFAAACHMCILARCARLHR